MSDKDQDKGEQALEKGAAPQPPSVIPEAELDFMRDFLQLQREQITIQQEEINIQKQQLENDQQQLENAHQFSLQNLNAMVTDRESARGAARTQRRDRLVFAAGVIILLTVFIGYAMYLDKDQIALSE